MSNTLNKADLKVALISFQNDAERLPSVGLVYIATYLNERVGIKHVKIIDKRFHDIKKEIERFSPDIIGIGPMTINYPDAIEFATQFKKTNNTPIIIGGVHISTLPESMKSCFDISVIGEGEETMAELLNLYSRQGKFYEKDLKKVKGIAFLSKEGLIKTEKRQDIDLDTLPFPNFDFINKDYFKEQEIPGVNILAKKGFVLTSRSCPYKCKFCSTSHFWGKVRLHSPEYSARLIKHMVDKYGVSYINIMDDLFTINIDRLKKIKIELDKLDVLKKIKAMDCQPRANLINDDLCQVMKELKIKIVGFGFESGSERVLNWLKGGSVTVEMNKQAIITCKKHGFIVFGSLMFGSPGEKIVDMKKTLKFIDFAIKHKADYIWSFISTPFPDTPFWKIALERGKVSPNMDFRDLSHHNLDNPLLLDNDVDKKEFKKIFLKGRKKLRGLKIKMTLKFFFANPISSIRLFAKSPAFYFQRIVKKLFKN